MAHPGIMVPYIGMVPGGLMPGKKITFHGMVVVTSNRFSINLQCGPNVNPRDDIALHMNFRYDQQVPYVVRNSLQMQQWGLEEGHGYLSFARGHTFEIRIDIEHDHFKIFFNGHHFTDFRYRIPINRVTYITVDSEVVLHSVKVDGYELAAHYGSSPVSGFDRRFMGPPMPGMAPHMGMPIPAVQPVQVAPLYPGYPRPAGHMPPSSAIPMGVAAGLTGVVLSQGYAHNKKAMKKQQKAMKKAMKHKHKYSHGFHGYHRKSSSSSSSSSEEE